MVLSKERYDKCEELIKTEKKDELINEMRLINDDLAVTCATLYQYNSDNLKDELKNRNRFLKLFTKETKDTLSFECGILKGITLVYNILNEKSGRLKHKLKPWNIVKKVTEMLLLITAGFLVRLSFSGKLDTVSNIMLFIGGIGIVIYIIVNEIIKEIH